MKQPTAFIPSHSAPASLRPEHQGARVVDARPAVGHASGSRYLPALDAPLLSVRPNGDVTLTKALLLAIPHLRAGAPIALVPPVDRNRTDPWYLDTRSSARYRLPSGVARFTIPLVGRRYFQVPAMDAQPGVFGGARGAAGFRSSLAFTLGPEHPEHPGYFELLPVRERSGAPVVGPGSAAGEGRG